MSRKVKPAYLLAPMAMDLADNGVPVKIVALGHRSGAVTADLTADLTATCNDARIYVRSQDRSQVRRRRSTNFATGPTMNSATNAGAALNAVGSVHA